MNIKVKYKLLTFVLVEIFECEKKNNKCHEYLVKLFSL